jgi:transcriptional regulator with XRE-family HTH domain
LPIARRNGKRIDNRGAFIDPGRFRLELARRGLTARRLAALSGVGEVTIARARRHQIALEVDTLRKLAEALASQPVVVGIDLLLEPVNTTGAAAITPPRRNEEARASGIPA